MSVDQLGLVTRPDEFDLGLEWNAKAEIEFDPIFVILDRKFVTKVANEGTIFREHVATQEDFTQTVKGLCTARLWWPLPFEVFDARRAVDSSVTLDYQN